MITNIEGDFRAELHPSKRQWGTSPGEPDRWLPRPFFERSLHGSLVAAFLLAALAYEKGYVEGPRKIQLDPGTNR